MGARIGLRASGLDPDCPLLRSVGTDPFAAEADELIALESPETRRGALYRSQVRFLGCYEFNGTIFILFATEEMDIN